MAVLDKRHFQNAMTAIDDIERSTSRDTVADIVQRAVRGFGFEHFCCLMPRSAQHPNFDACLLMTRWPPEWRELYRKSDFQRHDPIVHYTRTQYRSVNWAEAPVPDHPTSQAVMILAANEFLLRAGISVPIHGIDGYQGGVSFGGYDVDDSKEAKSAVELIAIYAFNKLNHFRAAAARPAERLLTSRQREVLSWAANGKSAWDTAKILNVSQDNVQKILGSAITRLKATNRTHAVVEAIRQREIDI